MQAFADSVQGKPSSRARTLAAVKSLLAFGQRTGYLALNVGAALKLPSGKDTLAQRILSEADEQRMPALEPNERNRTLLALAYVSGVRVSELCRLTWRDCLARDDGGQVTVFGKGDKTRVVLPPDRFWRGLLKLRNGAGLDAPVFRSRRGGQLDPSAARRIVWAAAARAGLEAKVSPHWLRHSHATHALERGAPFTWSRRRWGIRAWRRRASTCTRDRRIRARATWWSRRGMQAPDERQTK